MRGSLALAPGAVISLPLLLHAGCPNAGRESALREVAGAKALYGPEPVQILHPQDDVRILVSPETPRLYPLPFLTDTGAPEDTAWVGYSLDGADLVYADSPPYTLSNPDEPAIGWHVLEVTAQSLASANAVYRDQNTFDYEGALGEADLDSNGLLDNP